MEYELRDGDDRVASLRFRSSFGTLATGESADGCWTFKRVGFWQTRATIRARGSDSIWLCSRTIHGVGRHTGISRWRKFLATTNFWQTQLEFKMETGEPLFHLKSGAWSTSLPRWNFSPRRPLSLNCPWMVMLAGI